MQNIVTNGSSARTADLSRQRSNNAATTQGADGKAQIVKAHARWLSVLPTENELSIDFEALFLKAKESLVVQGGFNDEHAARVAQAYCETVKANVTEIRSQRALSEKFIKQFP